MTQFSTQNVFRTLSGHARGEIKAAAGDISITSLLAAIRPNKQVALDPTCGEMSELARIARCYLAGLGSVH